MSDLAGKAKFQCPYPLTCTVAVLYWMWQTTASPDGDFMSFLSGGRTDVFLKNMADKKGGRIIWKKSKTFWNGAVVIWTKSSKIGAAHAGVNIGNNTIAGHNQGGFYNGKCPHGTVGTYCTHKSKYINTSNYKVYTVGPKDAMEFLENNPPGTDMW